MRNTIIILSLLVLTSCSRGCQEFERNIIDNHDHEIRVTQFSGGQKVGEWEFNGIVTNSANSDGYCFYYKGKLIEVSGDIKIEYLD